MAFYMEEMTVQDMILAMKQTTTAILPVAVVEQHGYHLPLSTDIHIAVQTARAAGDQLNAVVAPSVNYAFSGGELPGTINISPNTFGLLITDICQEFVRMGFTNIIILLGHGGTDNTAALKNTLQMILRRDPELARRITLSLIEVWTLSPTWMQEIEQEPEHEFHACKVETALLQYWKPELVRDEIVMDEEHVAYMMRTDQDWFEKREKVIDHPFIIERVGQRDEVKIGVMGHPELSTPEFGELICREMADGLVAYVNMLENFSHSR